ncbi:hypothetical protein GQ457_01G047460 [Hibiscus cannabinus]
MGNESYEIGSSIDDDPYEDEHVQVVHSLPYYCMELITAGASTTISKTTVTPLERIKILLQTRAEGFHLIGVYASLKKPVKNEGLRGLYKANGLVLLPVQQHFCALIPLDLVRTKYAYQVVNRHQSFVDNHRCIHSGLPAYRGIKDIFKTIYKQGGMSGLYQGVGPTLGGILPYNVLKFYSNEELKRWAPKEDQSSIALNLSSGALAALFGQTVMYPLDVVRRQMHVDILNQKGVRYRNTIEALKCIVHNQGWRQLYAGLCINYIKDVPSLAIGLTALDVVSQRLHFPQ